MVRGGLGSTCTPCGQRRGAGRGGEYKCFSDRWLAALYGLDYQTMKRGGEEETPKGIVSPLILKTAIPPPGRCTRQVLAAHGGGRIDLYGAPVSRRWTRLASTASATASSLELDGSGLGWAVGQRVVVTSSSWNPWQAGSRQLPSGNGRRLSSVLCKSLRRPLGRCIVCVCRRPDGSTPTHHTHKHTPTQAGIHPHTSTLPQSGVYAIHSSTLLVH